MNIYNKKRRTLIFTSCCMVIFQLSCGKDFNKVLSTDTTVPMQVSDVTVRSQKGQVTISYTIPKDPNLSYVKAEYTLENGTVRTVKASYYENELVADGFGDTTERELKLYSVNRAEIASDPIVLKVKPLENPIWDVYKSLKVTPDFGGVRIEAKNETKADVAIQVLMKTHGVWGLYQGIYTKSDSVLQSLRGFDTLPHEFAISVRDRFFNTTDTLFKTVSPYYEEKLDKSLFRGVSLPGDAGPDFFKQNSKGLAVLWDGIMIGQIWPNVVYTDPGVTTPQRITIDLGQTVKLSRMVIYDYPENYAVGTMRNYFYGGDLKNFEIWGSNSPASDGSFNGWTLMGTYNVIKPSGLPYGDGSLTSEDFQAGQAGFNCDFPPDLQKIRYIRIKSIVNWVGTTFMTPVETVMYGDPR